MSSRPATGRRGRRTLRIAAAFLRRDLLETFSYRVALAVDAAGILFTIGVFYFIAQLVDRSAVAAAATGELGGAAGPHGEVGLGAGYFPFVLVGLAFYGYLGTALRSFAVAIRQGQLQGTLEAMLATSTPLGTIVVCSSLSHFCYTSLQVVLYLGLGSLVFGAPLGAANLPATLLVVVLAVLAFSGLGIASAAFVLAFKRGDPIAHAVNAASGLLGGVYFPVAVLPPWLGQISPWLPITYALRAARRTLLEGAGVGAVGRELGALVAFVAVLLPLGLVAFRAAVKHAKATGTLAQY